MSAVQLLSDGVAGYGLPLDPKVLVDLDPFSVARICVCLELDDEQTRCVEDAVKAVQAGCYPRPIGVTA